MQKIYEIFFIMYILIHWGGVGTGTVGVVVIFFIFQNQFN